MVCVASALGLFEPDEPDVKTMYTSLIQNFNRFVLEQLHQECSMDRTLSGPIGAGSSGVPNTSPIQQIFGMKTASTNICGHCGMEEERITYPFVLDLQWPKPATTANAHQSSKNHHHSHAKNQQQPMSFSEILQTSVSRESHNRVWCTQCQQYQPTTSRKTLLDLPFVLSINTAVGAKDMNTPAMSGMFLDDNGKGSEWLPLR